MKTFNLVIGSLFLATSLCSSVSFAGGDAAEVSPWSFNLKLASNYVPRGYTNSGNKAALQGGVDYTDPSGFNVGFWGSTVSQETANGGNLETDWYAGYTKAFGDVKIGTQIYYYIYPGAKFGNASATEAGRSGLYNYGELVPQVNYKWLTAQYWYTYTSNYFGYTSATVGEPGLRTRGSGYFRLKGNFDLSDLGELAQGVSLQVSYGHQEVKDLERWNWSDAKLGLTKSFGNGLNASVTATTLIDVKSDDKVHVIMAVSKFF